MVGLEGIPLEISSEKAANDWRRRRHREKIAFAASSGERSGEMRAAAPAWAIAHDFVGFCSSIQATPLLFQPSYRAFPTIVANYAHQHSKHSAFCTSHLLLRPICDRYVTLPEATWITNNLHFGYTGCNHGTADKEVISREKITLRYGQNNIFSCKYASLSGKSN